MSTGEQGRGGEQDGAGLLLTHRDIRELAEAAGIRPSKQRGQNFVMDPNTVRTIVGRAGVEPGQAVLEVGPGLGSLTLGLLEAQADVVAVELDRGLAELLPLTLRARGDLIRRRWVLGLRGCVGEARYLVRIIKIMRTRPECCRGKGCSAA